MNAFKHLEKIVRVRYIPEKNLKFVEKGTYGFETTIEILKLFYSDLSKFWKFLRNEEVLGDEIYNLNLEKEAEVTLNDVAGLIEIKKFIKQRLIEPFEDVPYAERLGLRVGGGILLFGPPGTGKTLIAEAISNHLDAKYFEISPSIIVGYPGEAEKKIELIFNILAKEPRGVLLLDEAEWLLCKRDMLTSSVMQRVIPTLLAQISQIFKDRKKPKVLIAATNKPYMIDPAFLRSGRFDKVFYVPLPDYETRKEILKIHLKPRACEDDLWNRIDYISKKLEGYSGVDILAVIEEAAYSAFARRVKGDALINYDDLLNSISKVKPSVSVEDVKKIEEWAIERGYL